MRPQRHKVTLLGLGAMGQRHARVLGLMAERFEFVGAYDPRREAASPEGISRLSSESEAIARADLVIVATPTAAHASTVARALAAGRHVLVEKPLCGREADAAALLEAAARGEQRLFVGHSERFNPAVRALRKVLRGEPVTLDLHRAGPTRSSDVGVLLNLGVHDFDLAAYFGGGRVRLRGAVGASDFADVLFETAAGAVGHIHVDRATSVQRRALTLTTTDWTYDADLLSPRLIRVPRIRPSMEPGASASGHDVPLPLEEPLVAQARAVADALDGAAVRELASGADGAAAVLLALRATALCATPVAAGRPSGLSG